MAATEQGNVADENGTFQNRGLKNISLLLASFVIKEHNFKWTYKTRPASRWSGRQSRSTKGNVTQLQNRFDQQRIVFKSTALQTLH
jgi:hypothetical protein